MAEAYNVDSAYVCENTSRKIDGAYMARLHYFTSAGPRLMKFPLGPSNPLDWGLKALTAHLHELSPELQTRKHLEGKAIPLENFLGLSIVRHCVRPGHGSTQRTPGTGVADTPRTERVGSFVFVDKNPEILDIEPLKLAQVARINEIGIGRAREKGVLPVRQLDPLIHLPVSREEMALPLTMDQAVTAHPRNRRLGEAYVLLHTYPEPPEDLPGAEDWTPQHVEQLVSRDEILR